MDNTELQTEKTQTDFIREDLNFDIDPKDPLTKAALSDHPADEWIDIFGNGQLKKRNIKEVRSGMPVCKTDYCTLKIIGKLEDGTIVEEYENITIQSGDIEIVQGLDLVITLMRKGEIAEVEVASRFAYGTLGKEPNIPPNATIWYTVEIKSVELETDIDELTITQRKEIANKKRERGNWWFARDEPTNAIQCYRRALEFLFPSKNYTNSPFNEPEDFVSDKDLQALLEDRMKIFNNLTAAQIKTQAYDAALKSVENVLACQPLNIKALFRKGRILHLTGEHSLAYTTFLQAAKLEPESKAIQQELAILKEKNLKDAQHEKDFYRKMFGTHKINNTTIKNKKKNDTSNKLVWSLIGGAAVTVVGVLIYRFTS